MYSEDLNTELVWYLNGQKEVGCQIFMYVTPCHFSYKV